MQVLPAGSKILDNRLKNLMADYELERNKK